jgi:hypothetical protein
MRCSSYCCRTRQRELQTDFRLCIGEAPLKMKLLFLPAGFGECCACRRRNFGIQNRTVMIIIVAPPLSREQNMIPQYVVRRLTGNFEELSCFRQLEDESAALYFNIVHGAKLRRRFTTEKSGRRCTDYVLVARQSATDGSIQEREIALFDAS